MINEINRANLTDLKAAIIAALSGVEASYGVKFNFVGGNFTPTDAKLKLQVAIKTASGEVQTSELSALKTFATSIGLPEDILSRTITLNGSAYHVVGYKSRCRGRNNMQIKRVRDGKGFVCSLDTVIRCLQTS